MICKVTGTAEFVDLTYENEFGGSEQLDDVRVPWSKSFFAEPGTFVYLSAQNQGESGIVVAEIWVEGSRWKIATYSGAYAIASVSGRVGFD